MQIKVRLKLDNGDFDVVWVGDSRAYVWDGIELKQITKDHSLVQHMVDEGSITQGLENTTGVAAHIIGNW